MESQSVLIATEMGPFLMVSFVMFVPEPGFRRVPYVAVTDGHGRTNYKQISTADAEKPEESRHGFLIRWLCKNSNSYATVKSRTLIVF